MSNALKGCVLPLQKELYALPADAAIGLLCAAFPNAVTFSTSFSNEDQVVLDFVCRSGADVDVFTLDTGRLFEQTYTTWAETISFFGVDIKSYHPEILMLQSFLQTRGPNAFYGSVDNRKECCRIRKVVPLQRALKAKSVWITGIRAEHSIDRQDHEVIEWDDANGVIKFNPLLNWTWEEVKGHIKQNGLPHNSLHEKGFVSIGCEPCTRAVKPGEEFRSGRWWWEDSSKKECGLHNNQNKNHEQIHT